MSIASIIALIASLVAASRDIMLNVSQLTELFKKMNDEGRDTLTPEEEAILVSARDSARTALANAIATAPADASSFRTV